MLTTIIMGQNKLDITYDMRLEFQLGDSIVAPTIGGKSTITIINRWDQPLPNVYLQNNTNGAYEPNDPKTAQTIMGNITGENVRSVSDPAAPTVEISLDSPLDVGDTLTLTVPFVTRISGIRSPFLPTYGSWGDTTIYILFDFYPSLEYFYTDGWHTDTHAGAGGSHTNLAAFNVIITYPQGLTLATSAHTTATDTLDNGDLVIKTQYPRASSFAIVLGDNFEHYHANIRDVDVDLVCTPGQAPNADKIFTELENVLQLYESQFGPCPNDKITITMSYSIGAQAVATTNFISFGRKMGNTSLLAHEFAHQWFGYSILADQSFEGWLNESFAEYAARKYMRQHPSRKKKEAAQPKTDGFFDLWTDFRSLADDKLYFTIPNFIGDQALPPIYREGYALAWENLDDIISLLNDMIVTYGHGANALLMLEASIGDSMMQQIMLAYTNQYRWRTTKTSDFIEVIRNVAGNDIADNFFTAVTNSGRPDPRIKSVKSQQGPTGWNTTVTTATVGPWSLPLTLQLITNAGDTIIHPGILMNDSPHTFTTAAKVTSARLAPSGRIIDINPSNNRWPHKALMQPIIGIPNWEYYKLYLSPSIKSDWRGNMRYGLTLKGILGANLMPFTPSWYKNSFRLGINYAPDNANNKIGYNFAYTMPLAGNPYYQLKLSVVDEYPKSAQALRLTTYIGSPKYYFSGGVAQYTQVNVNTGRVNYAEATPTDWWPTHEYYYGQLELRWLRHAMHQRTHFATAFLYGTSANEHTFTKLTLDADHSHTFSKLAAINLWMEFRSLNDPQTASDLATRIGLAQLPFSDEQGISRFRGRTDVEDVRWDNFLAWGITVSNTKSIRFFPKLVLFADMALADQNLDELLTNQPTMYKATGIGLEGNSIISYGLYMPLWVSHPTGDDSHLKFRLMGQFRVNW
ncbi:M1 family aminopeptidase [Candidatus Neomarinimicrobiota bacterium]